jgi:ribose 5-phosphate isomerase B
MAVREDQIRRMVRRVVYRTLGRPQASEPAKRRTLVAESDLASMPAGSLLAVPPDALVTPLARQLAMDRRIALQSNSPESPASSSASGSRIVAIGADHGGFSMKESLKLSLEAWGYEVLDCGTSSADSVDYPDYAYAVAKHVTDGSAWRGVMLDGAGIGSCMTANKVPGVRAAMCYDKATAVNSREHNNANLLTLGASMLGPGQAKSILRTWLETVFAGGRHARRVDKIAEVERRFAQQRIRAR